jgi:hypothetical protein
MKIGNYTDDEILEFMTEGEGRGFLGRSMFDAMYFEIERLNNIINESNKMIEKIIEEVYKPVDKEWDNILCFIEDYKLKIKELKGSE